MSTLSIERRRDSVALVTLRRPGRLNAMSAQMFDDLRDAGAELAADTGVRAVVLAGEGRGFCPGFDLAEVPALSQLSPAEMLRLQERAAAGVLRIGLVTQVVAPGDLLETALETAGRIAAHSPVAVRMSLRSLYANVDAPSLRTALELENRGQALLSPGPDVAEALSAATDDRPPAFPD